MAERYIAPGWFTRNVFNRLIALLTRAGLSVWGSRVLAVRGRSSGEWRTTPVNLLSIADATFTATEVPDAGKADVLRAYLRRWRAEVGVFFDGVGAGAPDSELLRIAPDHPVFRIELTAQ